MPQSELKTVDGGADGQAMLGRRSRFVLVSADESSAFRDTGVPVRQLQDTTAWDVLRHSGELTRELHRAVRRCAAMWRAASLTPRVTGRYEPRLQGGFSADQVVDEEEDAAAEWRELMRTRDQSVVRVLEAVLMGQAPRRSEVDGLRGILFELAAEWGYV